MPHNYLITAQGVKSLPLESGSETWRDAWGSNAAFSPTDVLSAYQRVPWLYRAINAVSGALASLPYTLTRADGEPNDQPAPFPLEMPSLLDQMTAWLLLYGAAYARIERNRFGLVRSIRLLHPTTIQPSFSDQSGLTHYTRRVGDKLYTLTPDEVCAVWLPNRAAETGADSSPAQVALRAAGVLASLDSYAEGYFANGAVNPTLISINGSLNRGDFERLKQWYKRLLTGLKRAFSLEVIEGEVKATSIGYPLGELATPELTAAKREDIATALGVPHSLLFSNAATYATAAQDDLHFYEKTIRPLSLLIETALNRQVFTPLGWALHFKLEQLEVYQRRESDKAASLVALVQSGILTTAEARAQIGLPALPS